MARLVLCILSQEGAVQYFCLRYSEPIYGSDDILIRAPSSDNFMSKMHVIACRLLMNK